MAAAKPVMQVGDKEAAREWFKIIEDGVPEDEAMVWLKTEAEKSDTPQEYRNVWGRASRLVCTDTRGLNKAEYLVLRMYTMDLFKFYRKFNNDCRQRNWKCYRVFTSLLHSGLSKLRRKSAEDVRTLYRGLHCSIPVETTTDKSELYLPAFTSATSSKEIAQRFGSLLTIKSGTGPAIDAFSDFDEQEILFSPFQVFVALADKSELVIMTDINQTLPFLVFSLIRGALLGAVVGNCIGAPFEFRSPPTIEDLLKKLGLAENNDARKGSWHFTSDTSMILALADSLVRAQPLNIRDLSKSLSDAYMRDRNRNFGSSAARILEELHRQTPSDDPFLPAQKVQGGSGSHGNGGAMRIVPAALLDWNATDENFFKEVDQITRLTHSNVNGVNGAILQARAVQLALKYSIYMERNQEMREQYIEQLTKIMQSVETSGSCVYCDKLKTVKGFLSTQPTPESIRRDLGYGVAAQNSVPTAIYCFLRGLQPIPGIPENRTEFERTIIFAISLGGDTDTVASMAGAIAGAYYGQDSIPQRWRDICEVKAVDDAKRYAKDIHGLVFKTT